MASLPELFAQYGLLAVFFSVLVEQLGAPVPAVPILLLAGMSSADNSIFAVKALAVAAAASMLADLAWFYAGRRFGRRVLAVLCRISISPDSCVRQGELNFARRGVATLVVAKFIPGVSTLASPLAGAIGMRTGTFAIFNLAGTLLWAGSGIIGGLVFRDQVWGLLEALGEIGSVAIAMGVGVLAIYIAARLWVRWQAARAQANLPRVRPAELAALIAQGVELVIVDVRAILTPSSDAGQIPGARHFDLAELDSLSLDEWSRTARIITYCSCPNDASALKAASQLAKRGLSVSVLHGGIDGWQDAGYPLEPARSQLSA